MASTADISDEIERAPKKGKGLLIGIILMVALGAAGFYAAWSGMLPLPGGGGESKQAAHAEDLPEISFVPIDELVISLSPRARARHLLFGAEMEVEPGREDDVRKLMPRILDVLNTYLRAVEERDLEEPGSMPRLRAQMLRRIQIVTGPDMVRDLLITRFLLK